VPYVPTPQPVVDRMLELGKVGKDDVLYDLGCGDGRIVITAAKVHGAHGTGIDLNPVRIAEAQANAKKAGVEHLVNFKVGNLFEADVSPATVVTLYLLPTVNLELRPRLWKQLKVGTRVVSHAFDMGPDWPPEQTVDVDGRKIYAWTITQAQKRATKA
jgi:ribosomal protein L11 methylase PrmA